MEPIAQGYALEMSLDFSRWRPVPRGYRQDGIVLDRFEGMIMQSTGRGNVVFYRAVAIDAPIEPRGRA